MGRLPPPQIAGSGVLGQQERQRRRACSGEAEPDQWPFDGNVIDLGIAAVPILDLEALREVAGDPLVQERLAGGVQSGLVAQGAHEDLQAFTE